MSGGDRSAGDSAPLIPSDMEGQAPPPVAVAPESLPPTSRPLEAEDDPVVVPDTVKVASPEASKAGTSVAVTPLATPPLLEAEEDPVVVPDTVEADSSEAPESEVGASGVVPLMPTSPPIEVDEDLLVVPDTVEAASSEVAKVGAGGGVPLLQPSPPLEAEDDHLVVPATVDDASLEISEIVVPATVDDDSSEISEVVAPGVVLTDELRDKIVKQVEYYFSDENLPTDEFMLKFVKKNMDGFVPVGVIASFRKMKKLVQDHSIIEAALRTSSKLVVSPNGKRVRRLHPLPCTELKDVKKRTVLVENLPLGFSMESIQEKFGTVGKVMKITIHDPHALGECAGSKKPDFMLSNKVHAIVEYEAVEAAEKAVTTLTDERNWRTGMRVTLLAKRSVMGPGKHVQSSKENHGTVSKKNEGQSSKEVQKFASEKNAGTDSGEVALDKENVNSDVSHEEVRQHQKTNANSGQKGRYRSQGKGLSGQGHGSAISGSDSVNKPISGPKMPDGTRGFIMGRGRSLPPPKAEKAEE